MTYQISGYNGKQGDVDSDATIRDYWTLSYNGTHLAAFNTGFNTGNADLQSGLTSGHDTLMAVEVSQRDLDWNATLDGYNYATRSRGTNDEAPGFTERFDPAEPIIVHGRKRRNLGPFGAFRS